MPPPSRPDSPSAATDEAPPVPKAKPAGGKLSTAMFNFVVDLTLVLAVLVLGWVSALLQFVFPAPTQADGWVLWGLTYDQWRDVQFVALCVFAVLALEHLVLHWNWVCSVIATKILKLKTKPDKELWAVYGVGSFIGVLVVLLGTLIAATLSITAPPQ